MSLNCNTWVAKCQVLISYLLVISILSYLFNEVQQQIMAGPHAICKMHLFISLPVLSELLCLNKKCSKRTSSSCRKFSDQVLYFLLILLQNIALHIHICHVVLSRTTKKKKFFVLLFYKLKYHCLRVLSSCIMYMFVDVPATVHVRY